MIHLQRPASAEAPPAAQRLALKIDVDTLRGARHGVPALIELLRRHDAGATFLFALGPDQTGRSLKRILSPVRSRGQGRPGALERYGVGGLLHGTLLPAPILGVRAETVVRATADAGFEVGVRPWNPWSWEHAAPRADAAWTLEQMRLAHDRYVQILGVPPRVHGACGWQMNRHAFRLTQRLGFDYCSDTRGTRPYVPVINAEIVACPQIPTTLPTFDELLADAGTDRSRLVERMVEAMAAPAPDGHVLTLSADCEGIALLPVLDELLGTLRARGIVFLSLGAYLDAVDAADLPRFRVETGALPGSPFPMSMQFKEFLA